VNARDVLVREADGGMVVYTVGSSRIHRRASSGILIPGGIKGRRAAAQSTLADRFSGTKYVLRQSPSGQRVSLMYDKSSALTSHGLGLS